MKKTITVITSLYRCEKYLESYLRSVALIANPAEVEVLLLHNDPTAEELEIIRTLSPGVSAKVRHVIIPQREGLYRTWNRGVQESEGDFLAVWNVDDVRTPDSLMLQLQSLRKSPGASLCYGSYIGIRNFGERKGTLYEFPEYSSWSFHRSCYLTPFPMWHKSIHDIAGYFDEGFRSAGDYDFQIRAVHAAPFVKLNTITGYYLEAAETGISKSGDINNIERTVCELRYGIFDKLNLLYLRKALRYSVRTMSWGAHSHAVESYFRKYSSFIVSRIGLAPLSILRLPINVLRFIKHRVLPGLRLISTASPALVSSSLPEPR